MVVDMQTLLLTYDNRIVYIILLLLLTQGQGHRLRDVENSVIFMSKFYLKVFF